LPPAHPCGFGPIPDLAGNLFLGLQPEVSVGSDFGLHPGQVFEVVGDEVVEVVHNESIGTGQRKRENPPRVVVFASWAGEGDRFGAPNINAIITYSPGTDIPPGAWHPYCRAPGNGAVFVASKGYWRRLGGGEWRRTGPMHLNTTACLRMLLIQHGLERIYAISGDS